jgi:hypothetical protein
MARTCIFCGGAANSCEDAWPKWLTGRFIAAGAMEAQIGNYRLRTWRTERPEIRIRRVCETCNNGSMSQLETRVMPVITRLLDEPSCDLDLHDCRVLALWAVKTAMVLESVNGPEHWIYTDMERTLIAQRGLMPRFTGVWIAKCVNFPSTYSISRILSTATDQDAQNQARAGVTTMAFGTLAMQVLKVVPRSTIPANASISLDQRPGPWDRLALQVWPIPPEPVRWPASVGVLDEHGLETLAQRFSPVVGAERGQGDVFVSAAD